MMREGLLDTGRRSVRSKNGGKMRGSRGKSHDVGSGLKIGRKKSGKKSGRLNNAQN